LTFDRAPTWGWLAPGTLVAFVGALAAFVSFVVVENRVRWPLVDMSLFRNPRFSVLVVAGTVANIAYAVTIYLSTLNLQQVRGLDPLMAGLAFLGPSIGAALGGPLSGRLAARYPPVLVMGIGCMASALSLAALAVSGGWVTYVIALSACGFTLGLVYAFTTVATQAVVRPERAGEAAGVTLTSMVTLAGVGVAVSGTMLEVLRQSGSSTGTGIDTILLAVAAVLLPAAVAVSVFGRSGHKETMDRR
jgi:predicted MFS family arabinose efflux permease